MDPLLFNLAALAALVPAAILPYLRRVDSGGDIRDTAFWAVLAAAAAGAVAWTWALYASGWRTGIAPSLWLTISLSLLLFAGVAAASRPFARLICLFAPYTVLIGALATIWAQAPGRPVPQTAAAAWLDLHIAVSVLTYALITLAAVAALGVFLQERALKARKPSLLTAILPAVSEGERMQARLLTASAVVLGLGLATGMVIEMLDRGVILEFTHKILFSVLSFAVILALLVVHRVTGLTGRRAARYLLLAYLLLTLGYPGVKFVTDVIIG